MKDISYPTDYGQRFAEGWRFQGGRIVRISEDNAARTFTPSVCKFKTDEEAVAFVTARAAEGSEYHIKCLKYAAIFRMKA